MLNQRTLKRLPGLLLTTVLLVPGTAFAELMMLASISEATSDIQKSINFQKPTRTESILPTLNKALPDFSSYADVKEKKQAFFDYLLPMIRHSNKRIRNDRSLLLSARDELKAGATLDQPTSLRIRRLGQLYRTTPAGDPTIGESSGAEMVALVEALLIRVDVVPASLILAQAANESGWGTSRFAREANNLFGTWCFRRGCGIAPRSRDSGLSHEVASYSSVQEGIDAYILNINSHRAYKSLRNIRAESRIKQAFSGFSMAAGLTLYSARGEDYVREIQQLILSNDLQRYTIS